MWPTIKHSFRTESFSWKIGISVVLVGPGQVVNRSWFSPGPVSVLTQLIPKPASLRPHSSSEHAQNNPQSCSEHSWSGPEQSLIRSRTVLKPAWNSTSDMFQTYLDHSSNGFCSFPVLTWNRGDWFFQSRFLLNTIDTSAYVWVGWYYRTQVPFLKSILRGGRISPILHLDTFFWQSFFKLTKTPEAFWRTSFTWFCK